jgi:hypothetical protein
MRALLIDKPPLAGLLWSPSQLIDHQVMGVGGASVFTATYTI